MISTLHNVNLGMDIFEKFQVLNHELLQKIVKYDPEIRSLLDRGVEVLPNISSMSKKKRLTDYLVSLYDLTVTTEEMTP